MQQVFLFTLSYLKRHPFNGFREQFNHSPFCLALASLPELDQNGLYLVLSPWELHHQFGVHSEAFSRIEPDEPDSGTPLGMVSAPTAKCDICSAGQLSIC